MKKPKDIFGRIILVSAAVHAIAIVLLPSGRWVGYGTRVIDPVAFDSRNVVGSGGVASESYEVGKGLGSTALDRVVWAKPVEMTEAPGLDSDIDPRGPKSSKLRFSDRVGRRVRARPRGPSFMEVVRRRISDSCDRYMARKTRAAGVDHVVVLSISILPSGELESVDVIESSNVARLDKASVDAVKKAAPFPRFPEGLALPRLKLRVPIRCVLAGEGQ
jgi:TonB family protein